MPEDLDVGGAERRSRRIAHQTSARPGSGTGFSTSDSSSVRRGPRPSSSWGSGTHWSCGAMWPASCRSCGGNIGVGGALPAMAADDTSSSRTRLRTPGFWRRRCADVPSLVSRGSGDRLAGGVTAQALPNKPVTIVVPFWPAGLPVRHAVPHARRAHAGLRSARSVADRGDRGCRRRSGRGAARLSRPTATCRCAGSQGSHVAFRSDAAGLFDRAGQVSARSQDRHRGWRLSSSSSRWLDG